jgi:hypothetical protein
MWRWDRTIRLARMLWVRAGQLRKALRKLEPHLPECEGIDTARLYRDTRSLLEAIESGSTQPRYPRVYGK